METGGAAAMGRDWSALPLDVLLICMSSMEVPDVVRSGAVCTSWRSAYAAFRALGLPTPRQPPCLLYYARDSPGGPGTSPATLYSPSTSASFRVPMDGHRGGFLGSAHGWLFTTDEAANPFLLNPLTGARAALPPITTLERVKSSSFPDDPGGGGGVVYDVDFRRWMSEPEEEMKLVTARRARDWMYRRVAVSASPLAAARGGGAACVVLLIHMPYEELSFARPGDERWTSLSDLWPYGRGLYSSAVYSDKDGLFYVLRSTGFVHALDLMSGGPSPAAAEERLFACTMMSYSTEESSKCTGYLVPMPCGTRLLLVTRHWCRSAGRETIVAAGGEERVVYTKDKHVITTGIQLDTIDGFRMERLAGPGDHALFLGSNDSALYLPTKCLPPALSKQNCAYLTDDVSSDTFYSPPPMTRQDVGVWDFGSGSMHKLADVWPLVQPWLDSPAPIWITPSLY